MSDSTSTWPIATELPSELAFLANHISTYFNSNPPYNKAILGALIFTPPPQTPRLLLIQVKENADPMAFSAAWGVPSGAPKSSDLTLLHALSRIVLEQTGLHLSRVHTMSGSQTDPQNEHPQWIRLLFTCQVRELDGDSDRFSSQQTIAHQSGDPESYSFGAIRTQGKDPSTVPILLNPHTHRQHAWASEDHLQEFMSSGLYPVTESGENQYQSMLDAFALYRQDYLQVNRNMSHGSPYDTLSTSPSTSSAATTALTASTPSRSSSTATTPTISKASSKRDTTVQATRGPSKLTKSSSGRSSSSKSKPEASHFHRFRIS